MKSVSSFIAVILLIAIAVGVGALFSLFSSSLVLSNTGKITNQTITTQSCLNTNLAVSFLSCSITNGLVGYWPFDEGSGNTTADLSGNGNTGTLVNSPTWVPGEFGSALQFNGLNQYVTNSSNWNSLINTLESTNQITVTAWVNLFGYNNNHPQQVKSVIRAEGLFALRGDANPTQDYRVVGFFINNGTWQWATTSNRLPLNSWVFLVGTWNGQTISLYENATLVNSTSAVGNFYGLANPNITIGATWNLYEFFNGTIDDVRIYNRALSASEIQTLYNSEKTIKLALTNTGLTDLGQNFTVVYTINNNTNVSYITIPDLSPGSSQSIQIGNSYSGSLSYFKISSNICPSANYVIQNTGLMC